MAIQENAINGVLADVLKEYGLHATPELAHTVNRGKRCDVEVRLSRHDTDYVAVECKIAHGASQKSDVVDNAHRWMKKKNCSGAIGLCYPQELAEESSRRLSHLLESSELHMVRVGDQGMIGRWHRGTIEDLIRLCRDVGRSDTKEITDTLRNGILEATQHISPALGEEIATILEIPWDQSRKYDHRPPLIACLILSNMILLQNRLVVGGVNIQGLRTLMQMKNSAEKQSMLNHDWMRIQEIDYAPVVDPALSILTGLPTGRETENLLSILIDAVIQCAPKIQGLQLDHAGPLYHSLLETARYDGSFYTSTPASVLLAELAMPTDWQSIKSGGWDNIETVTNLKICDPACGTGTLLMASARTIEDRYIFAKGDQDDRPLLQLGLIEDVLHGMDINRHAIHLSAAMLTIMSPKIDYNKINLYNMWHGIDNSGHARAGSIELLMDQPVSIPGFNYVPTSRRASASGYVDEHIPDLSASCDLVIMNPPFTRNDIRNKWHNKEICRRVQGRETYIAKNTQDKVHRDAIQSSSGSTFFTPIADRLVNSTGTVAMIVPYTVCLSPSSKGQRALLTDKFDVEVVVTSHDNRRIFFSENTTIHESLIVARRKKWGGANCFRIPHQQPS
ncbi:MAG: N-6 DNA methylase [Bacteroidetes bacterium]|nr:N-6 DNA methylase [Bacteroidota bacterium]